MRGVGLLIVLIGGVLMGPASAAIYTWTDDQGIRHYSDTKQVANARVADLANGLGRSQPSGPASAAPQLPSPTPNTGVLKLVRPHDGEVFNDPNQGVPVALAGPNSRLEDGETLTYRLDDQELVQSPTRATRLRLTGVAPGAHRISVSLNYRGHQIRRSAPVRFTVSAVSQPTTPRPSADPAQPPPS